MEHGPTYDQWLFTLDRSSVVRGDSGIRDAQLVRRKPYEGYGGKKQATHGVH